MNRAYHKWYSNALGRDMELLAFGHAGRPILFFPTRMARFFDYENWGIVAALNDRLEAGEIQLFCVDSIDSESFYNKEVFPSVRIARHLQYEQYILNEVLPLMRGENDHQPVEVAGCSMGAYHAVNIALKHPGIFKKVVGMSGRYDLTVAITDFADLFDGFHSEDVYFNMPLQYIANLTDKALLAHLSNIEIILVVGLLDPFLESNRQLSALLAAKNIPHQLHGWNGYAHRPFHWRRMAQLYL